MIWIGTCGWIYPHWVGRFYPKGLPAHKHLRHYAQFFPTVEINRSFYRLPTPEQFAALYQQTQEHPDFRFAVKASRYLTHMKKLRNAEEGITRLVTAAEGLKNRLGPFLYQLPGHWHANPPRLETFIQHLPHQYQAAFEFRDPTWFEPEHFSALSRILEETHCTLAIGVGGSSPTCLNLPKVGPFSYIRMHSGTHGIGFTEKELSWWAQRLTDEANNGREIYVYFNNDAEAYAIHNALRLREMLGLLAVPPN
jgi:uncharacterized protein YecE (DUF72 family)